MRPFLEAIEERVLVCDGAMGTMLYAKGIFLNRSFDAVNLSQPDLVAEVHQGYVNAGADVLETNTFGANRVKLGSFGLADKVHAINVQGARIARHAARERAYVAGAIGPLGIRIEPWGKTGVDEAREFFREQAVALLEGGVDLFLLETFRDPNEIGAAIDAVRSICDLPVVAQMTIEDDGNSLDGTPPEVFAPALEARGASVIGVNCSVGPAPMLETIERIAAATALRLSAQPNAGRPRQIEGRYLYLSSPEYMASYARRFIMKGVRLVGGCCGTSFEHIRAIKAAVRGLEASVTGPRVEVRERGASVAAPEPAKPVAKAEKSRMAHAVSRGKFISVVELEPPRGHQARQLIECARLLRIRGVDLVNVPDVPRASGRMGALSAAVLVEQQAGIEALLHYTCRDRNLLGMQSDLLGAHAMGIRNLLVVTGDPFVAGDYPPATGIFDVDSIGLTNVVTRLNHGLDVGGQSIGEPTAFHIGVAVNPTALDLDEEIRRFDYKVEAGAEFAITQFLYDLRAFETFLKRIESHRIPLIAAIRPFESIVQAELVANEMPGIHVPDDLLVRMRECDSPEEAAATGTAIAQELATRVRPMVQGIQVTVSPGSPSLALEVVEAVC
jgi:methionine synthase / methylenetetrahydrofolate reductase(NADPH)